MSKLLTPPLKLHWSIDRMKIGRNIGALRHPLCVHCPLFTSIETLVQKVFYFFRFFLYFQNNYYILNLYIQKKGGIYVADDGKKKVTLSLPVETNKKLEEMSKKFGMTKSGLVNFLINQVAESGTIYKQ